MKKIAIIVCFIGLVVMDGSVEAQGLFGGRRRSKARSERAAKAKSETLPVVVNGEKFEMVLVRGGSYMMGCDPEFWGTSVSPYSNRFFYGVNKGTSVLDSKERGKNDEVPRHGVSVGSFYMGRYEVTQALWKAVMGYNPSNFVGDELPVEQVSFDEVQTFIARLRELTGLPFRLPTEAEWEYAARGGAEAKSTTYAGSNELMHVSWTQLNSGDSTHIVGGLVPNELGLYDMTGNVWEWCSDWYADDTYAWDVASHYDVPAWVKSRQDLYRYWVEMGEERNILESIGETVAPKGPASGSTKVGRGGSWADVKEDVRVSYRNFWQPNMRLSVLGFRLVLSADSVPASGWMPNQYVLDSLVEGKAYSSMTSEGVARQANGVLEGVFSVSPTRQVRFSKGNLQYNAVADQWRFAERQYDIIGLDNVEYGKQYAGWIDLFSFGTSGYHNKSPYYYSAQNASYGNGNRNIDRTSYDWGVYNAISNGGNRVGQWRTLSVNEWAYMLMRRPNAQRLMSPASINGHQGMLLLPDDWLETGGDTLREGVVYLFSTKQWGVMERAGAVFLPCAGYAKMMCYYYAVPLPGQVETLIPMFNTGLGHSLGRLASASMMPEEAEQSVGGGLMNDTQARWEALKNYRPPVESDEGLGYYWTTIHYNEETALGYCFTSEKRGYIIPLERLTRMSVRLVQDVGN